MFPVRGLAGFGGALALGVSLLAPAWRVAADWPTARGNGGRTASTDQDPSTPLAAAWSFESGQPSPAWASEARGSLWQKLDQPFVPRSADDVAPLPVLAGGAVVFATTHDDVRCLDAKTGQVRWTRACGGPVRFAPVVAEGRVVAGADDGWVRAWDLQSGTRLWAVRLGPEEPWISGNGRLISPYPVRTGLLVSGGAVYATAGLFPLEGTYLVCLGLADGQVRWRRDLGNVSPQGYLVDAGADLIVPVGRATPRVYAKRDGIFRRELGSATGTLAVVSEGETWAGPGATGAWAKSGAAAGAKVVSYPGRHLAVTPTLSLLANDAEVWALDRARLRRNGGDLSAAMLWKRPCTNAGALMVAGDRVYVGGQDRVEVWRADSGEPVQTLPVKGTVAGLAAEAGLVVATTTGGRIQAFRPVAEVAQTRPASGSSPATEPGPVIPALSDWLRALPSPRGWALWSGAGDPVATASRLVADTELHWVLAVAEDRVESIRQTLAERGLLGVRLSVVGRRVSGEVPVADHLFNLVWAEDLPESEVIRLACPGPSGVRVHSGKAVPLPPDPTAGRWTHQYGQAGNTAASTQTFRGSPRLQWFGGHGPERMPDRHTRGHAPLAAGGLVVSVAENGLVGTDARNGTVRWQVELPGSMRYAMPYDAGYVVLADDGARLWAAVGAELWELDPHAGTVKRRLPSPQPGLHWGWVAQEGGRLYGSVAHPSASRTKKEYDLVDLEYRSGRPLVGSKGLVGLDPVSGGVRWQAATEGLWVNPCLAAAQGRVFAVEARGVKARADRTGRLPCAALLEAAFVVCLDGETGRRLWEQPLRWDEAEDILGLAVSGDHLVLSCARSAGAQAAYHLRVWRAATGEERWRSSGLNPIQDLFHGQQVKRPVVLGDKVSFESDVFELGSGRRWTPAGAARDWILKRPGHACGGMTGAEEGLLFRADNPTFFRFADGSFTRLSPTRPGCWLNILPVEGGVVIPEASASCICGYPLQASLGFAFGRTPAPRLPDVVPEAAR
jgi:outer membrane protein assembly factor BamB